MLQVHWTISFRSFKTNTLYTISILDDSYAGSPIPLIGGADPISTKEVDDEDVFTPIRTQSGYIRIVDNGKDANGNTFDWHDLIPATATSRPITLTHTENNTTVIDWAGFIQPQTFKSDFGEYVAEREFPICDELTVLEGLKIQAVNTEYTLFDFAYIIDYIFSKISSDKYTFHFCGGSEIVGWLQSQISWGQMAELDVDKNIVPKYNCREILEEICKVFGWTCRQQGYDIYFDSATDSAMRKWLTFPQQELYDITNGHEPYEEEYSETTLQGLPGHFVSTSNRICIVRGWHKSQVTASVNKIDAVVEYPEDDIEKYLASKEIFRTEKGRGLFDFFKIDDRTDPESGDHTDHFNIDCTDVTIDFRSGRIRYQRPGGYEVVDGYSYPQNEDYKQEQNPHTVDLKKKIMVYHGSDGDDPLFSIKSKKQFSFSSGKFVISAKTCTYGINTSQVPNSYSPGSGIGYLAISLKIGNKYWNGSAWTNQKSIFAIETGGGTAFGEAELPDSKIWNDGYPNFSGTAIPVNGNVNGYIELGIWEFWDFTAQIQSGTYDPYAAKTIEIEGLKIQFIRPENAALTNNNSENKYVNESTSPFTEEKEVSLMFFTDNNNQYAENVIFNADGTYCTTMTIAGENVHPEQHLVDRMAAWGAVTHEVMEVKTDTTNNAASVTPECVIEYNGKQYSPISISRNWRDDTIKFKYIELLPTQTNS